MFQFKVRAFPYRVNDVGEARAQMQTPFDHFPAFVSIQGKRRSWNSLCPVGLDPTHPSGLLGLCSQGAQNTPNVRRPTNPVFARRRRDKSTQPALRHWIDGTCKSQSCKVFREPVAEASEHCRMSKCFLVKGHQVGNKVLGLAAPGKES